MKDVSMSFEIASSPRWCACFFCAYSEMFVPLWRFIRQDNEENTFFSVAFMDGHVSDERPSAEAKGECV